MFHLSSSFLLLQYCSLFILHFIIYYSVFFSFFLSLSFFSSPSRYSTVNVELHFNVSLIILAPSTPILFPVHITSYHLFIPVSFSSLSFFLSLLRYSVVNVELHFNASLIILAPSIPILLSVHVITFIIPVSVPFLYHSFFITSHIQFSQCRITFQCFTYHSRSFWSYTIPCSYYIFIIYYSVSFLSFLNHSFHHYSDPVQSM